MIVAKWCMIDCSQIVDKHGSSVNEQYFRDFVGNNQSLRKFRTPSRLATNTVQWIFIYTCKFISSIILVTVMQYQENVAEGT